MYLGIDVGSVSTNVVLIDDEAKLLEKVYLRTNGRPIQAIQQGIKQLLAQSAGVADADIHGVGTTGSGRSLAAAVVGADVIKNEITAHAAAVCKEYPNARTILEIGGQDSKIILIDRGMVRDFAMNTVCAAGTGSFLDRQAARLNLSIEELGRLALNAEKPTRIAGRCAVFAESDMIHRQQEGYALEDILGGLCRALARNFINNLGRGKRIQPPVVFQGGVAANPGMVKAFKEEFGEEISIPRYYDVMGAYGAALLARETMERKMPPRVSQFKGFSIMEADYATRGLECDGCNNQCEIVALNKDGEAVAYWGSRCGKINFTKQ